MRDTTWRETTDGPFDGETRRLEPPPAGGGRRRCAHFPWQALWLIWPLMVMLKGAFFLATPALAWLSQPLILTITPLPLLLVSAGVAALLIGAARRHR